MLSAEAVHHSAVTMATGFDAEPAATRKPYVPVAALAIWSCVADKVALSHQKGTAGLTFPIASGELPLSTGNDPDQIKKSLAEFFSATTDALGITEHTTAIHGLGVRSKSARPIFKGTNVDGRLAAILPFAVFIGNRPQLPGASWYSPSEAPRHLQGEHPPLSADIKLTILRRLLKLVADTTPTPASVFTKSP